MGTHTIQTVPKYIWMRHCSKQRQTKKRTFQESEEEIEPEDALNLMFDYFEQKFEGMQAQINKNMDPPARNINQMDTT